MLKYFEVTNSLFCGAVQHAALRRIMLLFGGELHFRENARADNAAASCRSQQPKSCDILDARGESPTPNMLKRHYTAPKDQVLSANASIILYVTKLLLCFPILSCAVNAGVCKNTGPLEV